MRLAGHGGGSDVGERSLSSHHGLACLPQHALGHSLTLAKDQRCTQTHTHTREKRRKAILHWPEAEVREDYWTHCLPSEFTIHSHFSSFSISVSISLVLYFLASSLSPFLSTKRSVACQGCKLLTPPFLVSKQVILFSIPVSAETVIICPLKRSHTLRRNAGKACQRNCWGWFGRENYKWPFTTNTEPPPAAHLSISPSFCFFRNYRSKIYGGELVWRYILLLDRGDCNYRLVWVNHKGRE